MKKKKKKKKKSCSSGDIDRDAKDNIVTTDCQLVVSSKGWMLWKKQKYCTNSYEVCAAQKVQK